LSTVGIVAYTVVCFVTLDCSCGVVDMLYHYRHSAGDRQLRLWNLLLLLECFMPVCKSCNPRDSGIDSRPSWHVHWHVLLVSCFGRWKLGTSPSSHKILQSPDTECAVAEWRVGGQTVYKCCGVCLISVFLVPFLKASTHSSSSSRACPWLERSHFHKLLPSFSVLSESPGWVQTVIDWAAEGLLPWSVARCDVDVLGGASSPHTAQMQHFEVATRHLC